MMRYLLALLIATFSLHTWAVEVPEVESITLSQAPINQSDIESIKRGAKFFATTCMSCHTLKYLRYDKIAEEAGITLDKMPLNVKTWPNGITPPDLSLEADARGVNWIYTYLHSFYQDPARATGVNNLLVHNTGMSGILVPYQGEQVLVENPLDGAVITKQLEWYNLVKITKQGTMSSEDFDKTTADVTNFLAYAAEPFHIEQQRIGYWVLGFLVIMFVLMVMLKKEYWKDVKKKYKDEDEKK